MEQDASPLPTQALKRRLRLISACITLLFAGLACNYSSTIGSRAVAIETDTPDIIPTLAPIRIEDPDPEIESSPKAQAPTSTPENTATATAEPTETLPTKTPIPSPDRFIPTVTLNPEISETLSPADIIEEGRVFFSYEVAWFVNSRDASDIIGKILIEPLGGQLPYFYFWNGDQVEGPEFAIEVKGCETVTGEITLMSSDEQLYAVEFSEETPCAE